MSEPFKEWTVLPHGDVIPVTEGLWTVEGTIEMPLGQFERRMTIARRASGGLVVFSPVSLDERGMKTIDDAGPVEVIVAPSARHRMDVRPWKDRYPAARVVAPAGAWAKVEELVPVARLDEVDEPGVALVEVPGTAEHEAAMIVTSADGVTVVLNELVFNVPEKPGFTGWVMGVLGMTGEAHMPAVIRLREVKDRRALAAQLRAWTAMPELKRLIVSHGKVIEGEAARGVLEKIANELDG